MTRAIPVRLARIAVAGVFLPLGAATAQTPPLFVALVVRWGYFPVATG